MDVANGVFPNKEAILRAMGFSEFPTRVDVLQLLYYIISNSCWFNDILMRYMPNYQRDLIMGVMLDPNLTIDAALGHNLTLEAGLHSLHNVGADTPFFASSFYSHDRYLQCALMEYNKLFRYMQHCSNKGLWLDCFCGELRVFLYDDSVSVENLSELRPFSAPTCGEVCEKSTTSEEKLEDFPEVFVSLNKQKIRDILKTRSCLSFYKNDILDNIHLLRRSDTSHDKSDIEYSNNSTSPVRDPSGVSTLVELFEANIPELEDVSVATAEKYLLTTKDKVRSCLFNLQDNFVDKLRQQIQYYEYIAESAYEKVKRYRTLRENMEGLKSKLENLQKYKLMDDLNMRAVEFCAPHLSYFSKNVDSSYTSQQVGVEKITNFEHDQRSSEKFGQRANLSTTNFEHDQRSSEKFGYGPICFSDEKFYKHIPIGTPKFVVKGEPARVWNVSMLPTELICIISSYVGEDVLKSVREISIMNRFFPTARDDVVALLKQWRKVDLTNYSYQVFLRYRVNFERNRYRRISVTKSTKKEVLIENILDGNFKLTFYEFLRDVFILSRILNSRRRGRRTRRN